MSKRIVGLDAIKGIAMCLVVLLHYSFYTKYYSSGLAGTAATVLCVVCVPLFFLVNGALLLPRRIKPHHYRNVLKMILVVLVWKVIAALFFVFANAGHQVSFKDFLSFLLGGQLGGYPAGYFWFMNALIGIYLVFPLVKQAFDSRDRKPLIALVAVIFGFTVCKDTLKLLLQLLGMVTGHEFASLLGGLGEFYIFGNYGYTLLYFITGGFLFELIFQGDGESGRINTKLGVRLSELLSKRGLLLVSALSCYILTFCIQRFQNATQGANLIVLDGYWLLPTYIGASAFFCLMAPVRFRATAIRRLVTTVGKNTFGIYMLHMFALTLFSKLQQTGMFAFMGTMPGFAVTIANIGWAIFLFACCCCISLILRRVPIIGRMFSL